MSHRKNQEMDNFFNRSEKHIVYYTGQFCFKNIRKEKNHFLPHSLALTNEMVGLFSKEVVEEKVRVVEAKVEAVDSKALFGLGLEVLAVAGLSFALFAALCVVTLLQLTTGGVLDAPVV